MPVKTKTEIGELNINDNVFASLAGISAMESYGIVGMASKDAKDGFFELLKSDSLTKGIKVYIKDNLITIDMYVILEFGVNAGKNTSRSTITTPITACQSLLAPAVSISASKTSIK